MLSTEIGGDYSWLVNNLNEPGGDADFYAFGQRFTRPSSSPVWFASVQFDIDMGFKTYVTPIPEPSTFLLLGTGLLGLLGYGWRTRKRAARV